MTKDHKVIRAKVGLLELARQSTTSLACSEGRVPAGRRDSTCDYPAIDRLRVRALFSRRFDFAKCRRSSKQGINFLFAAASSHSLYPARQRVTKLWTAKVRTREAALRTIARGAGW